MTVSHAVVVPESGLAHLPLALFAAPMGIGGLGLAWRAAHPALGVPAAIGEGLLLLSGLVWVLLAALHVLRALSDPARLVADLHHPIRAAFAGAVGIGLMIMAGGLTPYDIGLARVVWLVAITLQTLAGLWVVRVMLKAPRDSTTLTPPLLIPLVGSIVAPVFGVALGYTQLSWMLFGIGGMLWLTLQPMLFGRLASGPALPLKLRPSLAILLAPPAVASLALWQLTGAFGPAPVAMLGYAIAIAAVLASLYRDLVAAPFSMAWWSVTFPSAAFVTAIMAYLRQSPADWSGLLIWPLLVGASVIVGIVATRTLRAALAGQLLRPE